MHCCSTRPLRARYALPVAAVVREASDEIEGAASQDLAPLVEASLLCELVYPDQG